MIKQKAKNYIPYFIFAVFCTIILAKPFGNGDELWNYSFAKNIVGGMVPYRDFSIVQTPLSAYVPALFMFFLGDGLFAHRIVGYLLLFAITAVLYHLCKKATGSIFIALLSALFVVCMTLPFYVYNYNYLSALMVLIILEIETSQRRERGVKQILLGVLVGLTLLVKQNTGAMLVMANFIISIINMVRYRMDKKIQIARILASALPAILFSAYMLFVGAMDDFLDYAVLGIATFTHRTTPLQLIAEAPFFLTYIAAAFLAFAFMVRSMCKEGCTSDKIAAFMYAVAWLMVTYPLFDAFHLVCVFIVLIPVFCMFIQHKLYKRWEKITCIAIVTAISLLSVAAFLPRGDGYALSSLNNYENILNQTKADNNMRIVCEYIEAKQQQGYRVRITDDSAIAYKIPMDQYEKNWDMLLVGNIGTNSVEDLLKSDRKCVYLVYRQTEKLGGQNHFEVIQYIKEHYVKVEEVLVFDVYEEVE